MRKMNHFLWITLLLTAGIFASCKNKSMSAKDESSDPTALNSDEAEDLEGEESTAFITKFNQYIEYFNRFNGQLNKAYELYFKKGLDFTPSEKVVPYIHTISANSDDLKKAISQDPSFKTDAKTEELLQVGDDIKTILENLNGYYERKDYKADNFKLGLEEHNKLKTLFPKYFDLYHQVRNDFSSIEDEVTKADLDRFQKNGFVISYNLLLSITKAERIVDMLEGVDGPELAKLDVGELEKRLAEFREPFDKVLKEEKNSEQVDKEFGTVRKSYIGSYITNGNEFIASIRDIEDRIENNDFEFSITHPSIPDKGSSLKAYKVYEEMINDYNNILGQ